MEIRNLESFIQVAELGSFTKAAESLGYTQSSVSTQIRQLETELGIPLFERINHSVKLTEKGKEILSLAHQLFRTADDIKKTADNPLTLSGHIRIAIAPSLCHWLFQHNFEQFHQLFPEISLELISTSTETMFQLLNRNEVDLVYTLDHHIYDRNYVIAYEAPVACHFVCSAGHPLACEKTVSWKTLIRQSFVLTERSTSYQKLLDEYLTSRSMEITPFLELSDTSLITSILQRGSQLSFLPDYVTEAAVQSHKLTYLHVPGLNIEIWKQVLYHKNKWISPALQAIMDYLGGEAFK